MSHSVRGVKKSLTPVQRDWLNHLKACEAQGCSSVVYARSHGLSVTALYAARTELTQRGAFSPVRPSGGSGVTPAPVTFVPVELRTTPAVQVLRVVLPNGVVIEVPEQAEPSRCGALVAALCGVAR